MLKLFGRYARENPLGNKVLTSILLTSTFLAFLATAFQLFIDYRHNMSGIELRMYDIQRSYPNTLAASMWNMDTQQTHTQIQGISNLPDISHVMLLDPENKILEEAGSALNNSAMLVTQRFPIEYIQNDQSNKKAHLGSLVVTANVERIYTEIRNKALVIFAAQTTKTMLVALFSLFIFNYLVSRHLSSIAHYANKIDLKNLDMPLILSRKATQKPDELDVVVTAFNTMALSIKKEYDQIEEYKKNLEHLVEIRTEALAEEVKEKDVAIHDLNHEIQERKIAEREAVQNEQRYKQLVEMLPDAIVVEVDNKIIFFNESTFRLFETEYELDILNKSMLDFVPLEWQAIVREHLEDTSHTKRLFECKIARPNGTLVDVEMSQDMFIYHGKKAIQTVVHDITKHKHYEEQLRKQALHDALTGLPNRILLNDRITQEIHLSERHKQSVYVIFLDLDRFKYVNDTLGHDAGDELLKIISQRMQDCIRKSDTLARLGGDEFVIVMGRVDEEQVVYKMIDRLNTVITVPMVLNEQEVSVSASIGISQFPRDGKNAGTLLKYADSAMYQAKLTTENSTQHYSHELHERVNEHLIMESRLRHAVERNELVLYYQPIFNIQTGDLAGAEALVRWNHPAMGMIAPNRFIPLAEETGLIIPIGNWVLQTACAQAKKWHTTILPQLRMSVNLSVQQLIRPNLENEIQTVLDALDYPPQLLELEITESTSMSNPERIIMLLNKLKHMGLQLAIDDFGTGYSNLSYLKELPVDHLKLDRIFTRDISQQPKTAMLIQAIINIAHNFNLSVVAEGVEEEKQMKLLMEYGCNEIQGYYFNPPLTAEDFERHYSGFMPSTKSGKA